MSKNGRPSVVFILFGLALVALLAACAPLPIVDEGAASAPKLEVLAQYDPGKGELPEGIAIDSAGTIYVSLGSLGELRAIAPDGTETLLTTLDTEGGFGMLGLAVDGADNLYAAVSSGNADVNGVHMISSSGESTVIAGSEAIGVPNAIAFDSDGNLFVTDTVLAAVWRISPQGEAEMWLEDESLAGTGDFGFGVPIGANGIAYHNGALYVANTEKGQIVRIALNEDSSAGSLEILDIDPDLLLGADGIVSDSEGNLYVVSVSADTLSMVDMTGDAPTVTLLAEGSDGLDGPASLVFGTAEGADRTIYITNFALISEEKTPGIVTFTLD